TDSSAVVFVDIHDEALAVATSAVLESGSYQVSSLPPTSSTLRYLADGRPGVPACQRLGRLNPRASVNGSLNAAVLVEMLTIGDLVLAEALAAAAGPSAPPVETA